MGISVAEGADEVNRLRDGLPLQESAQVMQEEDRDKEATTLEGTNESYLLRLKDGDAIAPPKSTVVGKSAVGWVPEEVAAAVLRVPPEAIRDHVRAGRIVAKAQREENDSIWLVSVDSVQKMLQESRKSLRGIITDVRENAAEKKPASEEDGRVVRELIDHLEARTVEAASTRAQLEQAKRSESALREERERLTKEVETERGERKRLSRDLEFEREKGEQLRRQLKSEREEHERLRKEFESEREERLFLKHEGEHSKGSWRRLFGG